MYHEIPVGGLCWYSQHYLIEGNHLYLASTLFKFLIGTFLMLFIFDLLYSLTLMCSYYLPTNLLNTYIFFQKLLVLIILQRFVIGGVLELYCMSLFSVGLVHYILSLQSSVLSNVIYIIL